MFLDNEDTHLLVDVGLTKIQAKLYMTLLRFEEADGKTLSKKANVPRPEVYRALGELEKKGLVEKVISTPYRFKATPLDFGMQILITQRARHFKEIQEKAKQLLRKHQTSKPDTLLNQKSKFTMIEGRLRLIQVIKLQHNNAQLSVDILTTLARWMQILHFCFENYEKAIARGVKYRVVLEAVNKEIMSYENIRALLEKQNFNLRLSRSPLKTNAAIFDQNELTINFYPAAPLGDSPLIWTNHPSFISMCQDHFEAAWKTARKC